MFPLPSMDFIIIGAAMMKGGKSYGELAEWRHEHSLSRIHHSLETVTNKLPTVVRLDRPTLCIERTTWGRVGLVNPHYGDKAGVGPTGEFLGGRNLNLLHDAVDKSLLSTEEIKLAGPLPTGFVIRDYPRIELSDQFRWDSVTPLLDANRWHWRSKPLHPYLYGRVVDGQFQIEAVADEPGLLTRRATGENGAEVACLIILGGGFLVAVGLTNLLNQQA